MSKSAKPNLPADDPDPANIGEADLSTNEAGTVVPWGCGEFKVALRWISPAYNQFTREAPDERPGKK